MRRFDIAEAQPPGGAGLDLEPGSLDAGQVSVRYEPLIDILSGSATAVEAQARWTRPAGEALQGDSFQLYAESYGLVEQLGHFAVERVVADLLRARARGWDVSVVLPVSALQITAPQFAHWLLGLLHAAEIPGKRLTVELSEHALDSHPSLARSTLLTLRSAGVGIQLSGVGSTAGTQLLLRMAPITSIKLDQLLSSQILESPEVERRVGVLLARAESLRLDAVVAGVSSSAQLHALRRLGCRRAQGPLWSGPQSLEDALAFNGLPRPRTVT